jgi:hypothetical protein
MGTQEASHAASIYFGVQGFELEDVEIPPDRPLVGLVESHHKGCSGSGLRPSVRVQKFKK